VLVNDIFLNKATINLYYLCSTEYESLVVQINPACMTLLASSIDIDPNSSQAIYVQLSNGIINLIQSGVMKPGTRLPSIRAIAKTFKLHPKTIVAAYKELMAQDWIYSKPRSGVIVSENLPRLKPRAFRNAEPKERIKLPATNKPQPSARYIINDGFPDYRLAPIEQLMRSYKNAFYYGHSEKLSMFTDLAGSPRLRSALARHLSESRALKITTDNVLVTRGAQMAIYLVASLLIEPGDYVFVGEPGYASANAIFEQLGAKLVRIPVDAGGMDVTEIEKSLKTKKPKLVYVIPHHHHPTTVTLSAARRMKLLSLMRDHKFYIIEDDYDYEFHYNHRPILPLASADHNGYVVYIGSITKNLSYSLRAGYLVASEGIIGRAINHKNLIDSRGDLLLQDALAALYENGTMQRHIRKSLKLYHERRDFFCELLDKKLKGRISFKKPQGGMAVWVRFDKKYSLPKISAIAATKGLWMKDGSFYNSSAINYNSLRIGFASLDRTEMVKVVEILAQCIEALS